MANPTPILDQISNEELINATQAARLLRVAPSTVCRWALDGAAGVHLEHVVLAGRVCFTRDALERFLKDRTQARRDQRRHVPQGVTAEQIAHTTALEAELAAEGL
jgi:hypothetical protein